MKLDDGRLTFVAQQEVTALDAIHKAVLGKAACAGRVTEGVGTCISIHAPTWGATSRLIRHNISLPNFNPRTHVGCDSTLTLALWPNFQFQSTHPRGVRLDIVEGVRPLVTFQSTHPRGVRLPRQRCHLSSLLFQSTHPRGVRRSGRHPQHRPFPISIHAPTWGATFSDVTIGTEALFQSTHPRGVRRGKVRQPRQMSNFNPRTHVGCDFVSIDLSF